MSSNTLRGIGQEGDGEGDADAEATPPPVPGGTPRAGEKGVGAAGDELKAHAPLRSLDSTIPGTRSLDASVPDAGPSLDAKIPALAATLMGVAPPEIVSAIAERDKGTVHGRDVHLPVEVQRMAGVLPVTGLTDDSASLLSGHDASGGRAATVRLDSALFNSVRTAAPSSGGNDDDAVHAHPHPTGHGDLGSHGPWYDQDPTGGREVYDETKPNILGRAAIGVAVAAGLSVLIFGAIRMSASSGNAGLDTRERTAPSQPGASEPDPYAPAPRAEPAAAPQAAEATPSTEQPPGSGLPRSGVAPAAGAGDRGATGETPPAPGLRTPPRVVAAARPLAPAAARTLPRPGALAAPPAAPEADIGRDIAVSPPPVVSSTANAEVPAAPQKPASEPAPPAAPTTPPKAVNIEKSRAKPAYDPDSTLPLNLD